MRQCVIWVYGRGDEGIMAFTDFGIETLVNLFEIHKADPDILKPPVEPQQPSAAYAACLRL